MKNPSKPTFPPRSHKRVFFIQAMGIPGSYDASVYEDFEDKDDESAWFKKNFQYFSGITFDTRNVCINDDLPTCDEADGLVLAGSYNSVHDNTAWQRRLITWISEMRNFHIPILAICGSHQLLCHSLGSRVVDLEHGPHAGTFEVELTALGQNSPLMKSIPKRAAFHYANSEHVIDIPAGTELLAQSDIIPLAALDFGNNCFSTQFHPEATERSLATVWRFSNPERMQYYHNNEFGNKLVENFLNIVIRQ